MSWLSTICDYSREEYFKILSMSSKSDYVKWDINIKNNKIDNRITEK